MEKKESKKVQDIKNQTSHTKKLKASRSSHNPKDKNLPWWVELLFVQIGLPDKWLIKILKAKKSTTEIFNNEKRFIVIFLILLSGLTYFYPVVKYSKTKLDCETIAKKYILESKNLNKISKKQLKMLTTNFCNGGNEIYEIQSFNN